MPRKTDFNSLDNACVEFHDVKLPRDALLSGISFVDENGNYKLVNEDQPFSFVTVAQRLLSGRICIAGCALSLLKRAINEVETYGNTRMIPTGKDQTTPLSELPVMRDLLDRYRSLTKVFEQYSILLENEFMSTPTLSAELVDKIACAKIEAIAFAINAMYALKEGVGSLSLFEHGPFGSKNDLLYVFRFAEGDSAILQQKLARDAVKKLQSPIGLLKEALKVPMAILANHNGKGVYRAQMSMALVSLALKLNGPKSKMMEKWLESHAVIKDIAHKRALLTILDAVSPSMKGTKEFAMFQQFMNEN